MKLSHMKIEVKYLSLSEESTILRFRGLLGDTNEPLDGDDVDVLCDLLKSAINLHEGNITEAEADEQAAKVHKEHGKKFAI